VIVAMPSSFSAKSIDMIPCSLIGQPLTQPKDRWLTFVNQMVGPNQ
jgi:hypothetical protein